MSCMKKVMPNKIKTAKYTKYNFIPLNLYYQFRKFNNLFFLVTLVLLCIPSISPFTPYTYIIAFTIIIGISMVKDGIEDKKRHDDDKIDNNLPVTRINTTDYTTESISIQEIDEGEFVQISNNEIVPADIVFITSLNEMGDSSNYTFIETSNIDGETNLKKVRSNVGYDCRNKLNCAENLDHNTSVTPCIRAYIQSIAHVERVDKTNSSNFYISIILRNGRCFPQAPGNIILRGSRISNTARIIGLVSQVGQKTKTCTSAISNRRICSNFESSINSKLIYVFIFYFLVLVFSAIYSSLFLKGNTIGYLYLDANLAFYGLKLLGTNYIIYSYLIPLSLFVTVELAIVFMAMLIKNDSKLKFGTVYSKCRNSSVVMDIGSVELILSDKTGTLTNNMMYLREIYCPEKGFLTPESVDHQQLLSTLIICSSVELDANENITSTSTDELAIMKGLNRQLKLLGKTEDTITFSINGLTKNAYIIAKLEFTSTRQRMSALVIIDGRYILLTKGSEAKIVEMLLIKPTMRVKDSYRVLWVAGKTLDSKAAAEFNQDYKGICLIERDNQIETLFEKYETDMDFYGATCVEDSIQSNVKDCISAFKKSGIAFWICTGDKKETALSCARQIGLFVEKSNNDSRIADLDCRESSITSSLITNEIVYRASDWLNVPQFHEYCVIYRATPEMKMEIAKFLSSSRCILSVGDGNNDIGMLQASNISVGIQGREGTHAAMASDFSIPRFDCLKRLILVHGRYNLIRLSKVCVNTIYKNLFLICIQFFYNFSNGFSGYPVYNSFFLNYFNLLFTSAIPFSITLFDKDVCEEELERKPELYKGAKRYMSNRYLFCECLLALVKGIIMYWASYFIFMPIDFTRKNGKIGGYICSNNYFSFLVFVVVLFRQIRLIGYYTIFSYISICYTVIIYFVTIFGIQELSLITRNGVYKLYGMPVFWCSSLTILMTVLLIDFLFDGLKSKIHRVSALK